MKGFDYGSAASPWQNAPPPIEVDCGGDGRMQGPSTAGGVSQQSTGDPSASAKFPPLPVPAKVATEKKPNPAMERFQEQIMQARAGGVQDMPCFDSLVSASEDAMVSLTDLEGRVLWFSRNARDLLPSFFDNHLIGRTGLEFEPVAKSPLGEVVKGIIRDQPPSFETELVMDDVETGKPWRLSFHMVRINRVGFLWVTTVLAKGQPPGVDPFRVSSWQPSSSS